MPCESMCTHTQMLMKHGQEIQDVGTPVWLPQRMMETSKQLGSGGVCQVDLTALILRGPRTHELASILVWAFHECSYF